MDTFIMKHSQLVHVSRHENCHLKRTGIGYWWKRKVKRSGRDSSWYTDESTKMQWWTRFSLLGIGTRYRLPVPRNWMFNKRYDICWLPDVIPASQGLLTCGVLPLSSTMFLFIVQEPSSNNIGSQTECHTTRLQEGLFLRRS